MKHIFKEARIAEVAEAIAAGLRPHLENHYKSTVNVAAQTTRAHGSGLNTGEFHLSILRALTVLQNEQTAKLADLLYDTADDDDDDIDASLELPA